MQVCKRLANTLQVHTLVVTNLSAFKSLHSVFCLKISVPLLSGCFYFHIITFSNIKHIILDSTNGKGKNKPLCVVLKYWGAFCWCKSLCRSGSSVGTSACPGTGSYLGSPCSKPPTDPPCTCTSMQLPGMTEGQDTAFQRFNYIT